MRLALVLMMAGIAFAADPPKPVIPETVTISKQGYDELKAEVRLLKAQLASTQIQCQIAALPEVQRVTAELKEAQAAYEAAKPKPAEPLKATPTQVP